MPWLHFLTTHFSNDQNQIWYSIEAFEVKHPDTMFLARYNETKEISAVFTDCIKNVNVLDCIQMFMIQAWYADTLLPLHSDTSLIDLDPH